MVLTWPLTQDVTHPTGSWHRWGLWPLKRKLVVEGKAAWTPCQCWLSSGSLLLPPCPGAASPITFPVGTVQVLSIGLSIINDKHSGRQATVFSFSDNPWVPLESIGYVRCYSRAKWNQSWGCGHVSCLFHSSICTSYHHFYSGHQGDMRTFLGCLTSPSSETKWATSFLL